MNVIHIAAHLGAGAGKAISGIAVSDKDNQHQIILLDKPQKTEHIDRCIRHGVNVHICPDEMQLRLLINSADVVIINWWHHPAIFKVLMLLEKTPTRIALWSHLNGLYYPAMSAKFADCFDICMFTSEASLSPTHWSTDERAKIKRKCELVYGLGDFNPVTYEQKKSYDLHKPIRIGYVGSLNYAKMHPQFLDWCEELLDKSENVQIHLAGDPLPPIVDDVRRREKMANKVFFLGFQENIPTLLASFDLFVYLLNPHNFATTENAILEAMAVGLPIVSSNGDAEKEIITHGTDGFTIRGPSELSDTVLELLKDHALRERIGKNARETVVKRYEVSANTKRFLDIISNLMCKEKSMHDFTAVIGDTPLSWFLSGCRVTEKELFIEAAVLETNSAEWCALSEKAQGLGQIFKGSSKGSVFQYSEYFPNDESLRKICRLYN